MKTIQFLKEFRTTRLLLETDRPPSAVQDDLLRVFFQNEVERVKTCEVDEKESLVTFDGWILDEARKDIDFVFLQEK